MNSKENVKIECTIKYVISMYIFNKKYDLVSLHACYFSFILFKKYMII